jgi:hypothetical protein
MVNPITNLCWMAVEVTRGTAVSMADCTAADVQTKGIWEYSRSQRFSPMRLMHVPTGFCVRLASAVTITLDFCSDSDDRAWLWVPFVGMVYQISTF